MCKLCNEKPVYEFTNKRKLCKSCFIDYFQKKVLYTIRKFKMIERGDVIKYKKDKNFRGVVLEEMLKFIADKAEIKLNSLKGNKIAVNSSLDTEAEEILNALVKSNVSKLKKFLPARNKVIKPLYFFLDEEILLYAKLRTSCRFLTSPSSQQEVEKNIKFKKTEDGKQGSLRSPSLAKANEEVSHSSVKDEREKKNKIKKFTDEIEKKHPEVKRAIVNSLLELCG